MQGIQKKNSLKISGNRGDELLLLKEEWMLRMDYIWGGFSESVIARVTKDITC